MTDNLTSSTFTQDHNHAHRHNTGYREGTTPGAQSVTAKEKAQLIKGASQLLLDVLKKPVESTFVIIEEVDTDNWGWGGLPALEYRKKLAKDRAPAAD